MATDGRALVAALLLSSCTHATAPPRPERGPAAVEARIDAIIEAEMRRRSIPGVSVVVAYEGRTLIAKGYGWSDRERSRGATADTVYRIGSISKQFTAAAVMRLVDEGKLGVEDIARERLPNFPESGEPVRVRHLLRQTSGLKEYFALPGFKELDRSRPEEVSRDDLLRLVRAAPFSFETGRRWSYSNSNYTYLGVLVERVSGEPFHRFIETKLTGPIGLSSTRACADGREGAVGYSLERGQLVPETPVNMNLAIGDGGLCSTARDLVSWTQALAAGRVVSRASYERMITAETLPNGDRPPYGFGLSLVDLDGRRRVAHGGVIDGTVSVLAHYPDDHLIIALLANMSEVLPQAMERAIAREVLGLAPPRFQDLPIDADASRFMGAYYLGVFDVKIVVKGDRLRLEMPWPAPSTDLMYQGGTRFVSVDDPDVFKVWFSAEEPRAARAFVEFAGMVWYGDRVAH